MDTQSPFSFLGRLAESASGLMGKLAPPQWLVHEGQRRMVLLLNHVVMQEAEAQNRLARQKERVVLARWRQFEMRLQVTPAGLFDLATAEQTPDLTITVEEQSPWAMVQSAMKGDKPTVRIEGDVQLAAEINWMADHLRWDVEEDLARVIGDVPAHTIARAVRGIADAARGVVDKVAPAMPGSKTGDEQKRESHTS